MLSGTLPLLLALAPVQRLQGDASRPRSALERPPNILLVIADDLGNDLLAAYERFYPGTPTDPPPPPTPAIDSLVEAGLLFTDCWTPPVCSPTRAVILTGRTAQRTGVGGIIRVGAAEPGLQHHERTLPQWLRKVSPPYASAAVGKWHLASTNAQPDWDHPLGPPGDPWFDTWAGSLFNLNAGQGSSYGDWIKTFAAPVDPLFDEYAAPRRFPGRARINAAGSNAPPPGEYATVDTIDDAVHLVGTLPEPWFLYVAFNAPHVPLTPPAAPLGVSSCAGFTTDPTCALTGSDADEATRCMVQWMDNELGRLLCDLELEGLADRTVVVFIGDNGTVGDKVDDLGNVVPGAIVAPFDRHHDKGTLFQGGVNVPLIVKGPGVSRGVSHALVSSGDLLATVMELAGAPAPDALAEDSVSFAPILRGSPDPVRRTVFVEQFGPNFAPVDGDPPPGFEPMAHTRALRDASYKLIRRENRDDAGSIVVLEQMFDLRRPLPGGPQVDPYEQNDLRDQVTPGGTSPLDRAYTALLDEMQTRYPSLFSRPVDDQP